MSAVRTLLRAAAGLAGLDVHRIGEKAYGVAPKDSPRDAWFSLEAQRRALFARHGVDLVVDVGANSGQFGTALRRGYLGDLISFEPATAPFEQLRRTAAADPRWRIERCGLGAEAGELELNVSATSVFNSFLPVSEYAAAQFGAQARTQGVERVPVRRLDAAVRAAFPDVERRTVFLKIDTQGFDLQVFAGATALLPRVVGLLSEVSVAPLYDGMPTWLESLDRYQRAGFRLGGLFPVVSDPLGRPVEYDCLMVRE
jgi:FkbM family methyltransferase